MTITVMMIKILRVIWTLHYIWLNLCKHGGMYVNMSVYWSSAKYQEFHPAHQGH